MTTRQFQTLLCRAKFLERKVAEHGPENYKIWEIEAIYAAIEALESYGHGDQIDEAREHIARRAPRDPVIP